MDEYKNFEQCSLCQRRFRYGPHEYRGQYISAWKMIVCDGCHPNFGSDVPPIYHARVLAHLSELGITPVKSSKGLLRWPM
jgi:hypothetical protein